MESRPRVFEAQFPRIVITPPNYLGFNCWRVAFESGADRCSDWAHHFVICPSPEDKKRGTIRTRLVDNLRTDYPSEKELNSVDYNLHFLGGRGLEAVACHLARISAKATAIQYGGMRIPIQEVDKRGNVIAHISAPYQDYPPIN